jgi:hypothetical protein
LVSTHGEAICAVAGITAGVQSAVARTNDIKNFEVGSDRIKVKKTVGLQIP